jgi:trehalose/maltose hydrolase-like predicted phosphorylase
VTEWTLAYEGFLPEQEGLREALCTLGNGYFATRGAAAEARADEVHYPGTYVAGIYDRLRTEIAGRTVENEDLVNLPNWLPLTFRPEGGQWFDLREVEVLEYWQELHLRRGVLARRVRFRDPRGRTTGLTQRRLVHMGEPHLAALESTFVAEDWSGPFEVRSAIDGRVENAGVPRYRKLRGEHLVPVEATARDDGTTCLVVETPDSHIRVAEASRTRVVRDGEPVPTEWRPVEEPGYVAHDLAISLEEGEPLTVEKTVSLNTSRDHAIYEPSVEACAWVHRAPSFDDLLEGHVLAWDHLWRRFDIRIEGSERAQMILRLHIFHLVQTVSENTIDLDVGVPARGLHGEAYRGHIFWDELFIFPLLNYRLAVLTRSLLEYRHRRLPEARWAAVEAGYQGAMYPWQSGSDGRDESQTVHLNPRSGRWIPDHSRLQRHINIAIAYNLWQYWQVTRDVEFLRHHGAEMLVEIARFWASIATYDRARDRYEIRGVMGPDEYHDAYPGAPEPGLHNNAYTNVMAAWVLGRTLELVELLPEYHRQELWEELHLTREEVDGWEDVSRKMFVPYHDGVISQFEGYEELKEFDWEGYRNKYPDIQRLDRILETEGDSTNRYKLSKQADVLMLFYLLSADELRELFERLGYPFDPRTDIPRNIEYYMERSSHGSTLSRVVHSWILARTERRRSWELFLEALESDIGDIQGGTTPEGIHLGAMAGTVDLVQRAYGGLEARGDVLWLDPVLPEELSELELELRYRGHRLQVIATRDRLVVHSRQGISSPIRLGLRGEVVEMAQGETKEVTL